MNHSAYKVALISLEADSEKQYEDGLMTVLDSVNKKQIRSADDFYKMLLEHDIDKNMFKTLVTKIMNSGQSEDLVKIVFLLGEGRPMGENSSGKGLKILPEKWVRRQLDDKELVKRVKPKFWPLFREKDWVEEGKGQEKTDQQV